MSYSTTYLAIIINVLAQVLPLVGLNIAPGDLNTTAQVLVAVATGVWVLYQRYKNGGVTMAGFHK